MTARPDYLDRLKAAKRKKTPEETAPDCEWEGCKKAGVHKAPAGRNEEGRFKHFCVEHVREYNKNYNYFSGLKEEAIAKFQREQQATGGRPTWRMGSADGARASATFSTMRSGSSASLNRARAAAAARAGAGAGAGPARPVSRRRKLKTLEAKALDTLELGDEATGDEIKTAYKKLVKRHHPDANGGDRASEERFGEVVKAYQILKAANLTT